MTSHPITEDLVTHFPELHAIGFRVAVAGAPRTVFRTGRPIDVLHPGGSLLGGAPSPLDINHKGRLGAQVPAKPDVFVRAEVAGLRLIAPGKVHPRGALVARPDAPRPVVVLGHIAAWPADE